MKTFKLCFFTLILLVSYSSVAFCQAAPPIPKDVQLNSPTDYLKYKDDVLNCIDWLEKQPVNSQSDNMGKVNTFLLQWIGQSPFASLSFNSFVMDYTKSNPPLM